MTVQAERDYYFYEPASGTGLPHSPFNAIIAPRPIGWISSRNVDGVLNLAPYSFFTAFHYTPPIIGFASNGSKDTLANVEATGQFCWNLVTRELAEAMNVTSAAAPPEVDEFALAGLTPAPSRIIDTPHVAESQAVFECRATQIVTLHTATGTLTDTRVVFGEVVGVHIDRGLLAEGIYQTALAGPVLRGGGPGTYFTLDEHHRFDMFRPGPDGRRSSP